MNGTAITYSWCLISFLSCSIWKVLSLLVCFSVNKQPSSSCTVFWGHKKPKILKQLTYIHELNSFLIQNVPEKLKGNNSSKRNPIKTSDTLNFSIKSSFAFTAASQASVSIVFAAEATSTSFCGNKENTIKQWKHLFPFRTDVIASITFHRKDSSFIFESSAINSVSLTSERSTLNFIESIHLDFLSCEI